MENIKRRFEQEQPFFTYKSWKNISDEHIWFLPATAQCFLKENCLNKAV